MGFLHMHSALFLNCTHARSSKFLKPSRKDHVLDTEVDVSLMKNVPGFIRVKRFILFG